MREIVDAIMPIIAFLVVCALFSIPAIWGMVVSTSLLGHLSQLLKNFVLFFCCIFGGKIFFLTFEAKKGIT